MLVAILKQGEGFLFLTDLRITARGGHPGRALLEGLPAFAQKGWKPSVLKVCSIALAFSGYTV